MGVKGVIVAAGYGTRFLPVTRCVPKEMLPLVDRPSIDFVVQEFLDAGVQEILVLTSRRKKVLEDWFDRDAELDAVFEAQGARSKLEQSRPPEAQVAFVRQSEMHGAGHALLQVRAFVGDDPVVVSYPDDLFGQPNCTAQLLETWQRTGCSVLAAHDMPGADLTRYGVLDVEGDGDERPVRGFVEKPAPGEAPSTVVSLGRYLYTPDFFEALAEGWASHDPARGEYFTNVALTSLADRGRVVARIVDAPRWDTGTPLGLLQASVEEGLRRADLGADLRRWLEGRLAED